MDCSNDNGEPWDWQGDDCCLEKESNIADKSEHMWDVVSHNKEDLSYMFDEATPVKCCGDFSDHANRDEMNKEPNEVRVTSSQVKRRRMLHFNAQATAETIEEALLDPLHWVSGLADASASGYVDLDLSSEGWLAECFNDAEMHLNADDMNLSGVSNVKVDVTEYCNIPSECEGNVVQEQAAQAPQNTGFKGRKAYMQTPTKIASSIAYPFAFIKPCAVHGDVTLKDINQRICTPPPEKLKESNEYPSGSYPTSAFSGKPVVGTTKICTDGGKGIITIMRTRG